MAAIPRATPATANEDRSTRTPPVMKLRRRDLLAGLPALWIPRIARAATPAFGAADHLLILNAVGGLRSHALFNAVGTFQHNPFGTQRAQAGTEWALGAACGAEDIVTRARGTIDAFAKITADVAVLGCVDHAPGAAPVVDHLLAQQRIATGYDRDGSGLLSIVGALHPTYAQGFRPETPPPVNIGPSAFGAGRGRYAGTRPLILDAELGAIAVRETLGEDPAIAARKKLDSLFLARQPEAYAERIGRHVLAKERLYTYARLLSSPLLAIHEHPEASAGGFTNAELTEIFGPRGERDPIAPWGPDIARAIRLFGAGSVACVVSKFGFDFHASEKEFFPAATRDLVRQLAGLRWLLPRLEHPKGGTFWDRTVVAVISEFSRNNTEPTTGFNSGNGSDHLADDPAPQRNQAIAMMGGPIAARGRLIGATDAEMRPLGVVHSSRSLLSTFLDLLGIDHREVFAEPPIGELF